MFSSGRLSFRALVPIGVWSLAFIVAAPSVGGAQPAQRASFASTVTALGRTATQPSPEREMKTLNLKLQPSP